MTNAQHFDGFIGLPTLLPGYDTRYVPLHVYLNRALDAMYAHLRHGKPLPPSQVVRTTPRGGAPGAAPAITEANVPPIAAARRPTPTRSRCAAARCTCRNDAPPKRLRRSPSEGAPPADRQSRIRGGRLMRAA